MRNYLLIGLFFCYYSLFWLPTSVWAQTTGATLTLSPSSGTFNKGCSFNLDILLNTGSASSGGTDVVLLYDTTRFTAVSVTEGAIFDDYGTPKIESSTGKVTINALSDNGYRGSGRLATVKFSVVADAPEGTSQIKFDYNSSDKTLTTDTNVFEQGGTTDVLNQVTDGSFVIGSQACDSTTVTPKGGTGLEATETSTLPQSGDLSQTLIYLGFGSGLVIISMLGLTLTRRS